MALPQDSIGSRCRLELVSLLRCVSVQSAFCRLRASKLLARTRALSQHGARVGQCEMRNSCRCSRILAYQTVYCMPQHFSQCTRQTLKQRRSSFSLSETNLFRYQINTASTLTDHIVFFQQEAKHVACTATTPEQSRQNVLRSNCSHNSKTLHCRSCKALVFLLVGSSVAVSSCCCSAVIHAMQQLHPPNSLL